jgi:hypothetical protein
MKIAFERFDTELPKTSMVQIVDRAVENKSPVRPNKPLNIILGVVIGHWADGRTGLEPLFTLVGTFLGLAAALVGGIRMLMPVINNFGNDTREDD